MRKRHDYTFGDNDLASQRLRRLAQIYEPEARELLSRHGTRSARLAVDLGCGPGWSTALVREVLRPRRTVGLDASERFVTEARRHHGPAIEFTVHDISEVPFPVGAPDLLVCRFLLTHLRNLDVVLTAWARAAAPGARLLVHETERLEAEHLSLRRYYELLGELQVQHGQALDVGTKLEAYIARTPWRLVYSESRRLEKPASAMAELHLANLRTWREQEFARKNFDSLELDRLEMALDRIARGVEEGGKVINFARQMAAELPALEGPSYSGTGQSQPATSARM
jgi:SAM-dependent methyltransferase